MAYTTVDDPTIYFNTKLYTGNNTTNHSITGVGFQPDWVWIKSRNSNDQHNVYDIVRGATKRLVPNTTAAEDTNTETIKSFDSDGFTLGNAGNVNDNYNYASWNWKAGTSFTNDASATGIGTIDSSGSVSDTAGFSIVTRTGTASAGTIKHGLSTTPKMIITKMRNAAESWGVYHVGIGNTKYLKLDVADAEDSSSGVWNNTTPTTSVFSVGNSALVNGSGKTYVDYIFSDVKGYSKFGYYIGNGNANGTFVYTGFKPAMVIFKNTGTANRQWQLLDNKRSSSGGNNVINITISPNNNNDESWWGTNNYADFLSNGFKLRASYDGVNESSGNYIYMAFAENPFVTSSGVPACAR